MKRFMAIAGVPLPALSDEFETVLLPKDTLLAKPVQHHADMILTVFDGKLFCHSSYYEKNTEIMSKIADFGELAVIASNCERNSKYPQDVAFNTLTVGDKLICRADSVCPELKAYPIINTRQGYAGCTSIFAADTVVTADEATIRACESAGIPFYRISGKDIILDGYDTGFIGGACGVCEDTIYIYGDPTTSQSGRELAEFCNIKGISLVSIYDGPVTDIGGIKFILK